MLYRKGEQPFMESDAGWDYLASIEMRQMATWQGNARNPVSYFLLDEPDAQDYNFDDLPPLQRLGMMGQPLVERMQELRGNISVATILALSSPTSALPLTITGSSLCRSEDELR